MSADEVAALSYPRESIADHDDDREKTAVDAGHRICFTSIPLTTMASFKRFRVSPSDIDDYGMTYFA